MPYTGLTVVVPTRNRAKLAMNAILSILNQPIKDIKILVSDNSTIDTEAEELFAFCNLLTHRDVQYVRPKKPMKMSEHWDWAMKQSLILSESSHITYLTDRMIFKSGRLKEAIEIAKLHPDRLLCFNHDKVIDHKAPVKVVQSPWTGNVFEISSESLLSLVSRGTSHNCLPRMLNSIVPRSRILEIQTFFGNVFDSISPDFSFCFRVLEISDTIIYFDKSVLLHYALYRSNGESMALGKQTTDHVDFLKTLGKTIMNYASPVPQFLTVFNAICHEYCLVREQTGSEKFPEIERCAYLRTNAQEIARIENSTLKTEMESLLATHGYEDSEKGEGKHKSVIYKLFRTPAIVNRLKWISKGSYTKGVWLLIARLFAYRPPDDARFGFATAEQAIDHAHRFPRRRDTGGNPGEPLGSAKILAESP
jgi:hypothetical protein